MKKQFLSAAVLSVTTALSTAAYADYSLVILHTNDFHSRIEPINKYDSSCGAEDNAEGKCFGGTARLDTVIKDRRAASNNSILVDGGDQFQGSLFLYLLQRQGGCRVHEQAGLRRDDRRQPRV
ncbi:hypothetical protein QW131_03270 [Roseibium salinum]|nr:hypothetical protein [Roseibium salinum]